VFLLSNKVEVSSTPNRGASVVIKNPFFFKMVHKDIGQDLKESP